MVETDAVIGAVDRAVASWPTAVRDGLAAVADRRSPTTALLAATALCPISDDGDPDGPVPAPEAAAAAGAATLLGADWHEAGVALESGDPDPATTLLESLVAATDATPAEELVEDVAGAEDPLVALARALGGDAETATARLVALRPVLVGDALAPALRDVVGDFPADDRTARRRGYRRLVTAVEDQLQGELAHEGFKRLSALTFAGEPAHDPVTYWRTGFDLPAVHAGYAYPRTAVVDSALDRLADSEPTLLVGRSGSGKSTVCKLVADRWLREGRGSVLYRAEGYRQAFDRPERVAAHVRAGEGHVLVVVEDAPRWEACEDILEQFAATPTVSVLLDARPSDLDEVDPVPLEGASRLELPALSRTDCADIVDYYERVTGEPVRRSVDSLYERLAGDRADDLFHLAYLLAGPAGEDAGVSANVADAYERLEGRAASWDGDPTLFRLITTAICVYAAAGLPIYRELLFALDPDAEAIESVLGALDGELLFSAAPPYATNHGVWAALYLRTLLEEAGTDVARERFGTVVNALFGLTESERRAAVEARADDSTGETPGSEAGSADERDYRRAVLPAADLVEQVASVGERWPVLAPLYGTSDDDPIELPAQSSPGTVARFRESRGDMYREAGDLETALAEYEAAHRFVEAAGTAGEALTRAARLRFLTNRGRVELRRGDPEAADEDFARAGELARQERDRASAAVARRGRGKAALHRGDFPGAIEHFEASLERSRDVGDREAGARTLAQLGVARWEQGELGAAEDALDRGLRLAREVGDRRGEADCFHKLGLVAWERGDYASARDYEFRALRIDTEVGDRHGEAAVHNSLGNVAINQGDIETADHHFRRSLALFRELGDTRGQTVALTSLGNLTVERERYGAAREYFDHAADLFRELGDRSREADAENNLGWVALQLGEYADAQARFEANLEIKRELGDAPGVANTTNNLGIVARERGDLEAAREHHAAARDQYDELGKRHGVAESRHGLGLVARERGDLQAAETDLRAAAETLLAIEVADAVEVIGELIEVLAARGDEAGAREWLERGRRAADELDADPQPLEAAAKSLP